MRARYYNVSIKRFLNQDIVNGSITNSQSLNKFSYAQGNPIKLTDPFGLCPSNSIGHFILDMIGFIPIVRDIADAVNAIWYAMEGDYWSATMSAVSVLPIIGSMVGVGGKTVIKIGKSIKNGDKIGDIIKSVEKNAGKTVGDVAEKAGTKAAKEAAEKAAEEVAEKGTKKTASEAAGDVGKSGKISQNINMDKIYSHVFSQDHINNGIMNLGTSKEEIINKFFDIAEATSVQWAEGSNEIRTLINATETTIRFYVKNGQLINIDGFVGYSQRVIGKLISY